METFIDYPGRESLLGKTLLVLGGPFAVPVFMILMGYFVAKSKKLLSQNIFRGIKVFVLGLLLNIGLNFNLLLKIKYAGWQINPLEYVFGVDILYLAGLSLIFLALLKTIKKGRAWLATVIVFLVAGLTAYMNETLMLTERNYILPFIAGTYSWAYFPLFPWLAYPIIGFVFSHWEEIIMLFFTKQKIISGIIVAGVIALVSWFYKWGIGITINLPDYYHHTFWFFLWVMGVVILWTLFLRFMLKKFPHTMPGNFLQWLGKNITLFYIIQWLIIGNVATEIYQTQDIGKYIFWFTGIFSVTVLITWLIGKTNIKIAR
jgi:hypothetical protein